MNAMDKLETYLVSCCRLQGLNLRGFPLLPKFSDHLPHYRSGYNDFINLITLCRARNVEFIVDVGANHGDFAMAASKLFPSAKCLLIEPHPDLLQGLEKRAKIVKYPWIIEPTALAAKSGTQDFYYFPDNHAIGSLLPPSADYLEKVKPRGQCKKITCPTTTLDEVCSKHAFARVDLLKMDVEGAELDVLEGAAVIIKKTSHIILEFSLIRREKSTHQALATFLGQIDALGFRLVAALPTLWTSQPKHLPLEYNLVLSKV
jgi:FkbM family methyltransferase